MLPEIEKRENEQRKFNERIRLEQAAHQLIEKLCAASGIELLLAQEGRTGHMEIPEIWTLSAPIPVRIEDMDAIEAIGILQVATTVGENDVLYAIGFSRGGGWVDYQLVDVNKRFFNP